jgi:hypothetical protein
LSVADVVELHLCPFVVWFCCGGYYSRGRYGILCEEMFGFMLEKIRWVVAVCSRSRE